MINQALRYIVLRAEVLDRIERDRSADFAALRVVAIVHAADGEVGPSRWIRDGSARGRADAGGIGLQEVDFVQWAVDDDAGEDGEELEDDAASEEEDGDGREDGSSCHCGRI